MMKQIIKKKRDRKKLINKERRKEESEQLKKGFTIEIPENIINCLEKFKPDSNVFLNFKKSLDELKRNPFACSGKPHRLTTRNGFGGLYSKSLNRTVRLIYQVFLNRNVVKIIDINNHYKNSLTND